MTASIFAPPSDKDAHPYAPEEVYHLAGERLYFATHPSDARTQALIEKHPDLFFFSSFEPESYYPFCADFGPVDVASVVTFCRQVREYVEHPQLQQRQLIFYVSTDAAHITNATLLLSSYLVLEHGFTPEQAYSRFERIQGLPVLDFRDAAWNTPEFHLSVLDCLRGLRRATMMGWFDLHNFDANAREKMYNRPQHDISQVTPRLVAFATPMEDGEHQNTAAAHAGPFRDLEVTDVVRLSADGVHYSDERLATAVGVKHHDLAFTDGTPPPLEIVERFLGVCDAAKGAVAVHCLAGLGRTGTLIGCHLIRRSGFTAREAIGWLRLCRPGSVIGRQQNFLEDYASMYSVTTAIAA